MSTLSMLCSGGLNRPIPCGAKVSRSGLDAAPLVDASAVLVAQRSQAALSSAATGTGAERYSALVSGKGSAPGWIRTSDFCLRRAALYPLSYGRVARGSLALVRGPPRGVGPMTDDVPVTLLWSFSFIRVGTKPDYGVPCAAVSTSGKARRRRVVRNVAQARSLPAIQGGAPKRRTRGTPKP